MIALRIILIIIAVILILLMCPLRVFVFYSDELRVKLGWLFLRFTVIPAPPEKPKKKKPEQKKKEQEEKTDKPPAKKENTVKKLIKDQGIEGMLELIGEILRIVTDVLRKTAKYLVINRLDIKAVIVGEDSADTAIKYGYVCSGVYPAVGALAGSAKLKKHSEDITAGFLSEKSAAELYMKASIRPIFLLVILVPAAVRGIRLLLKIRK